MHSFLEESSLPLTTYNPLDVYRFKNLTGFSEFDIIQLFYLINPPGYEDFKDQLLQRQEIACKDQIVLNNIGTTACKTAQLLKTLIHNPYLLGDVQTLVEEHPERSCRLCFLCAAPIQNDQEVVFTNKFSNEALVVSAFSFHLLRNHEYCGDPDSMDRIDPSRLIQVLGLGNARTRREIDTKQPKYKQISKAAAVLHRSGLTICPGNLPKKLRNGSIESAINRRLLKRKKDRLLTTAQSTKTEQRPLDRSESPQVSQEKMIELAQHLALIAETAEGLCRFPQASDSDAQA